MSELPDIAAAKRELRAKQRAALTGVTTELRAAQSASVVAAVLGHRRVAAPGGPVLLFAPMPDEVDITALAESLAGRGVIVALPRLDDWEGRVMSARVFDGRWDGLEVGPKGIRHPFVHAAEIRPEELGAVIVPGLAFDELGNRLGRGAGFYDRFLARLTGRTWKVGVGLDVQLVPSVPCSATDRPLDAVVTPSRLIEPNADKAARG